MGPTLWLHLILIFSPLSSLSFFSVVVPDSHRRKWGFEYFWLYVFTNIWCTCFGSKF